MEEYKDIPGYENRYLVSDSGKVKSLVSGRILKDWPTKQGYRMVRLSKGNQDTRCRTIHLLVASAFLDHHSDGTQKLVVDHIDNDPSNNNLSNLQIISQRENSSKKGVKGYCLHKKTGLYMSRIYVNNKHKLIGYFKTPEEASEAYKNELLTIKKQTNDFK